MAKLTWVGKFIVKELYAPYTYTVIRKQVTADITKW